MSEIVATLTLYVPRGTLDGVCVDTVRLGPGIYIEVRGSRSSKVIVKQPLSTFIRIFAENKFPRYA